VSRATGITEDRLYSTASVIDDGALFTILLMMRRLFLWLPGFHGAPLPILPQKKSPDRSRGLSTISLASPRGFPSTMLRTNSPLLPAWKCLWKAFVPFYIMWHLIRIDYRFQWITLILLFYWFIPNHTIFDTK
jgi:hypothetical protein